MYKYFVSDDLEPESDSRRIQFVSDKVPSEAVHSRDDIVPLYDDDGRLINPYFHLILFYY